MSRAVQQILFELETHPVVGDLAYVSIVAFHETTSVVVPLQPPTQLGGLQLPKGNLTDYEQAFASLYEIIRGDCEPLDGSHRLKRPAVFFITDGNPIVSAGAQPRELWLQSRNRLTAKTFRYRPNIVALGFGSATQPNLCAVATPLGGKKLAYIAERTSQVVDVLRGIAQSIILSIGVSVENDDFVFHSPEGLHQIGCEAE
jgi:uncharacterized protein YegL